MRKSVILTTAAAFTVATAALPIPAIAEVIGGKCYNSVIVACPPSNPPTDVCSNLYEVPCHPPKASGAAASGAVWVGPTTKPTKQIIQTLPASKQ